MVVILYNLFLLCADTFIQCNYSSDVKLYMLKIEGSELIEKRDMKDCILFAWFLYPVERQVDYGNILCPSLLKGIC